MHYSDSTSPSSGLYVPYSYMYPPVPFSKRIVRAWRWASQGTVTVEVGEGKERRTHETETEKP